MVCFFFFQAEDGIRDVAVTGVQTCALPISHAAVLIGGGIGTVEALARTDPDSVWRIVHHSARPTRAEVRVWVRAAQAAIGSPTPLHSSTSSSTVRNWRGGGGRGPPPLCFTPARPPR